MNQGYLRVQFTQRIPLKQEIHQISDPCKFSIVFPLIFWRSSSKMLRHLNIQNNFTEKPSEPALGSEGVPPPDSTW